MREAVSRWDLVAGPKSRTNPLTGRDCCQQAARAVVKEEARQVARLNSSGHLCNTH